MKPFLFVRIPKTASDSVCQELKITVPHKTAIQWKGEMGDEFEKLFKFTIVRNPYDRFISLCKFLEVKPTEFKNHPLFLPQVDYVYYKGNKMVDYIGRFENFTESWKQICLNIDFPHRELVHTKPNTGERLKLEDVKDIVEDYYRDDFIKFGYTIGGEKL